jgi:hypothetical protein
MAGQTVRPGGAFGGTDSHGADACWEWQHVACRLIAGLMGCMPSAARPESPGPHHAGGISLP